MYDFNPKSASRGFQTPRSWEAVSDIVFDDPDLPEQVMLGLIGGTVGDGAAVKFMEYSKNAAKLPKASDILDGITTAMPNNETSLQFSLATSLCYEMRDRFLRHVAPPNKPDAATKKKFNNNMDNFFGFTMKHFKPEMVIMGARVALATFELRFDPTGMKNWPEFSDKYQDLILSA